MKKSALLTVFMAMLHCNADAQDALEPCGDKFPLAYYDHVNKIIDDVVGQPSQLQLTTVPAFQPESGVRLVGNAIYFVELQPPDRVENRYLGRADNGHASLAKSGNLTRVRRSSISPAVARRVELMYAKAIATAQISDWFGLDGVFYFFSTAHGACGTAWSPSEASRNGRLVQLLERLEMHTRFSAPIDLQRSEKSIVRLLQTLESD